MATVKDMVGIGLPAGLQVSLISTSNLFVWRYINGFNSTAITAGVGVAQKLDNFVSLPGRSVGIAITTFISQNVGAKNYPRCRDGVKRGLLLSVIIVAVLSVIVYIFAPSCTKLFNDDADVVSVAVSLMHVLVPLYFTLVIREVFLGTLRGYGNTRVPMILSLIGMIGLRQLFLAISMHYNHVIENVYYGYPLAWGATAVLVFCYYLKVRKKYI